jgi:monoamine oxidase
MLDYHAFNWYQNPYTMGAYAHFAPGNLAHSLQISCSPPLVGASTLRGEVTGFHHPWVAEALDSAVRVVNEILRWDFQMWFPKFKVEESFKLTSNGTGTRSQC